MDRTMRKDPSNGNKMINAGSETVAEKPAFRSAFKKRRCLFESICTLSSRIGYDEKMKVNERLRSAIFEVIDNQINASDPAETALTLERLLNEGCSDFQAKQLIGQAVVIEVIDALKNKKPYNEQRYIKNLRNLPKEPEA